MKQLLIKLCKSNSLLVLNYVDTNQNKCLILNYVDRNQNKCLILKKPLYVQLRLDQQ